MRSSMSARLRPKPRVRSMSTARSLGFLGFEKRIFIWGDAFNCVFVVRKKSAQKISAIEGASITDVQNPEHSVFCSCDVKVIPSLKVSDLFFEH